MDFAFKLLFCFHRLQAIFNKKRLSYLSPLDLSTMQSKQPKPRELNVVCEHQQEQFLEISINGNVEAFNAGFKKIFYGGILILRYYCFI